MKMQQNWQVFLAIILLSVVSVIKRSPDALCGSSWPLWDLPMHSSSCKLIDKLGFQGTLPYLTTSFMIKFLELLFVTSSTIWNLPEYINMFMVFIICMQHRGSDLIAKVQVVFSLICWNGSSYLYQKQNTMFALNMHLD